MESGQKTYLILVPGVACDQALWEHQIQGLQDMATIDVADVTQADSLFEMTSSILNSAPPRFALAGLSMGGRVALEIVRQAPERVTKLALLDTSVRPNQSQDIAWRRELINLAERRRFAEVIEALLPRFLHPGRLSDERLTGIVVAMMWRVGPSAFIRQQRAFINKPDSRAHLGTIGCETLVLCGRQDAATPPSFSEEIARAVPSSRLVVIDDCGHLAPLERPSAVTAAMRDWLVGHKHVGSQETK